MPLLLITNIEQDHNPDEEECCQGGDDEDHVTALGSEMVCLLTDVGWFSFYEFHGNGKNQN